MSSILAKISDLIGWETTADRRSRFWSVVLLSGAVIGLMIALSTPWKAFALVAIIAVIVTAIRQPQAVMLLLAVFIPFEPFLLKFIGDDIYVYARYFSEVLIYLLLAVAVWRRLSRGRRLFGTELGLPLIGLLLVAAASLVINVVPPFVGALGVRQIIRFILLFFAAVWLDSDERFARRLTLVMFVVVAFESLLALLQAVVGAPLDELLIPAERRLFESIQLTGGTQQFWESGTRVFATLGRYDQLGTFLCFFMTLAVGLIYQTTDRLARRPLFALLLVALPALVLTLSRASWFGFLLAVIVIGAWLMRDRRLRLGFLAVVIAVVAYWGYSGIVVRYLTDYPGQTPVERLFESFSYERWRGEYYGLGRVYWFVQTPLTVIPSSPLLGVGPGQYGGGAVAALGNTRAYEKLNLPFGVYGSEGYIDNNWFSLWGEVGTLGLIFYVWMLVVLARAAWRLWRRGTDPFWRGLALGYFGALLAVCFQAFLATYLEVRTVALYLWLYGALIYLAARREKLVG